MLIRSRRKKRNYDAPQRHQSHNRPMTRRELIGQGFLAGSATVLGGGVFSLFMIPMSMPDSCWNLTQRTKPTFHL